MNALFHALLVTLLLYVTTEAQVRISPRTNYLHKKLSTLQPPPMPKDSVELDSFIIRTMQSHHIVGHAGCAIKNGRIVYFKNSGYANLEQQRPVNDSTLFMLASISKTFVATAIMQLWEDGLFSLDDDINQYLPDGFVIRNPSYPEDPITFTQLLIHS